MELPLLPGEGGPGRHLPSLEEERRVCEGTQFTGTVLFRRDEQVWTHGTAAFCAMLLHYCSVSPV